MAAVHRGFGATLGIGAEVTWGTAVARTNWIRLISESLKRAIAKEKVPHLGSFGQVSTNYQHRFTREDFAGGQIVFPFAYDDSSVMLARNALGANVDSGAGPYSHLLTLASPNPYPMTLEVIRGTASSGSGHPAEVFEGCLISDFELSMENGGLLTCSADVIAETSGGPVAAGSPSYSSGGEWVKHNHLSSLTFNSTQRKLKSFKINVKRNLDRNHELGSLLTSIPVENRLEIGFEIQMLWQSVDWMTEFLADTSSDLLIALAGTGDNAMDITLHNANIDDVSNPVSSAGGVMRTITGTAYADATDQGLSIEISNGSALATAN